MQRRRELIELFFYAPPVISIGHVRPMSFQDPLAVRVNLNLPRTLHSGSIKTKVKPTDPGKQTAV